MPSARRSSTAGDLTSGPMHMNDDRVVFSHGLTYGMWQNRSQWPSHKIHQQTQKPVSARRSPNQPETSRGSAAHTWPLHSFTPTKRCVPPGYAKLASYRIPPGHDRRLPVFICSQMNHLHLPTRFFAQFCTKSAVEFVFSKRPPYGGNAQICTKPQAILLTPTIGRQLSGIGFDPQKVLTGLLWLGLCNPRPPSRLSANVAVSGELARIIDSRARNIGPLRRTI